MKKLFKKQSKKQELSIPESAQRVKIKPLKYPIKILVAWGEAIGGNDEIRHWLIKNGYAELGMFCFALRNEVSAQQWLVKNGYPHLSATIKAIEGEKTARDWLLNNGFEILFHIAVAADGEIESKKFLLNYERVYAGLSKKMEDVKNNIEWDNNSYYRNNP